VLFGQPELDVNLSEAHIRQLRERITHSFHLEPLGTKDIGEYLILRLRAAGYHGPHLFSAAAIKKLSAAAEGLARRVNILADKSLLAAYADNVYQVTPKHVKAAIQDSEFGRKTTNYKQYFIGASVLVGLLAIAMGYAWWQYQHQPKIADINNVVVAAPPKKAKIEAPSAAVNLPAETYVKAPNSNIAVVETTATAPVPTPVVTAKIVQSAGNVQAAVAPVLPVAASVASTPITAAPASVAEIKTLVDKRLEVTRNHLLSASPSTITLQIKSLPTDAKLNGEQKKDDQLKAELDRISQQLEMDNIYLYRKIQNGETYTVILYGEFAERSEALAALKNLPTPIKNNKPYLRTFAGINKDIDQTQ
jgi:septal ring-binding cell division protein DamX